MRNLLNLPFYLGCPVWSCAHWGGEVYPRGAAKREWLRWYSRVFNTVEGNSVFYGMPSLETAVRWCEESESHFRFALKVPQEITHQNRLIRSDRLVEKLAELLDVLQRYERLGPTFLQLPPDFSPREWEALEHFLRRLPGEYPWGVEVRHMDWFDEGEHERWLDVLLVELGMDKVLFDSRCLYSRPSGDESELKAQSRKPRTPHRTTVTGKHPMVRFIGRNSVEETEHFLEPWAIQLANWIASGHVPYFFTHAPDDRYAPQLSRAFALRLGIHLDGEPIELPTPPTPPQQPTLF